MKSAIRNLQSEIAFSLVEVLVVVAIVVVLLALLAPAMDKAIYETQMASCGVQLRTLANGVTTYAGDHQRHYPHRSVLFNASPVTDLIIYKAYVTPLHMTLPHHTAQSDRPEGYDDRPPLRGYFSLDALSCPMTDRVDLEVENDATWVFSSYSLWWGWLWQTPEGEEGMVRQGNRLRWKGGDRSYTFNVLASDHTFSRAPAEDRLSASHPDTRESTMRLDTYEDVFMPIPADPDRRVTKSNWIGYWSTAGTMDTNYAYDDGGVTRYDAQYHRTDDEAPIEEDRFVTVPAYTQGYTTDSQTVLPVRR